MTGLIILSSYSSQLPKTSKWIHIDRLSKISSQLHNRNELQSKSILPQTNKLFIHIVRSIIAVSIKHNQMSNN